MNPTAEKALVVAEPKAKYTAKPTEQVIETVISELEEMLVERTKQAREYTMLVMWETGKLLRDAERHHKINISALIPRIALDNRLAGRQMGERNLWTAMKFFDAFPKFEKVYETEHGENVSWTKIKKLLVAPKPKKEKTIKEMAVDIVERMGVDNARKLAEAIIAECDKQMDPER